MGQEMVVAQIGVRIKRNRSKKYDYRLAQFVRHIDGHIERGIVDESLLPVVLIWS